MLVDAGVRFQHGKKALMSCSKKCPMTNVSRLSQVALAGVGGNGPSLVFFPVRLFGRSSLEESLLGPLARAPCM